MNVTTRVVEGVLSDEALLVMEDHDSGTTMLVIKGQHGAVTVGLDDDGWNALAAISLDYAVRRSIPEDLRFLPVATALARDAMRRRNVGWRQVAKDVGVDQATMLDVINGEKRMTDTMVAPVAEAIGVPELKLWRAWEADDRNRAEIPLAVPQFMVQRKRSARTNRPAKVIRKEVVR